MTEPAKRPAADRPWLSVVLPTYRGLAYLGPALDSLCRQTDADFEVIVVDDGSGDGTADLARSYSDRLRLCVRETGHSGNWVRQVNRGLSEANGEWLAILHQDDRWRPERIEALKGQAAADPEVRLLLGPAVFIDAHGRPRGPWRCPLPSGRRLPPTRVLPWLALQNFIAVPAPAFARSLREQIGGLDEDLWYFADWEFWLRAAAAGPSLYRSVPLVEFRVHPDSQTSRRTRDLAEIERQFTVVQERVAELMHAMRPPLAPDPRLAAFARRAYVQLTAGAHGERRALVSFAAGLAGLGPRRAWRYLRASRLLERVRPRLRGRRGGG